MLTYMLDTDIVSYALDGVRKVAQEVSAYHPSEICISSITLAELQFGAARRGAPKLKAVIDVFAKTIVVAPFDKAAAERFAIVGTALYAKGTPIGQFDTLIAAHALSLNLILVTNNTRHFSR